MAFMIKRIIDLQGILFLMLMTVTSQATNLDCNGKAFHCVNSTHFMICVDLGRGISTTIDDFVIPCPAPTVCRKTNRFECEFTVPFIPSSTIVTTVTTESEITTVSPPPITTMSFEDNFNTVSTTTLSQTQVQQSSLDDSLSVKPIFITTSGLGITKLSTTEPIITGTLITTNVSSVPEVVGGNISDTSSSNLITDEVSVIHDQTTVNPTSANDVSNLNATVTYPTLNDAVTAESKQSKHLINVTITHGLTSNNSITETEVPLNVSPNEGLTIGSESTPAVIENKTDIISLVAVTELSLKEAVTVGGNNIPEQTTILLDNTTATAQIITTSEVPVTISDADTISIISEQTIVNNTNDTIAINATTEGSLKGTSYSDSMIGFDQTPTKTTTVTTSVNEVVNVSSNLGQNTGLKHMVTESENITETVATSEATEVPVKVSNILSQNAESKQNITRMERITENAIFITTTEVSTKKSMNEGQNFETKETVSMKGNRNKTVTTIGTTEIPVQPSSKFETVTISANEVPVNVSPNLDLNVESQQIVSTSDNLTESVATLATTKTPIKASSNSSQKIGLEQTVTASENISKTVTTSETTEIPVNVSNTLRQHTESKQNITSRIAEAPVKISSIAGHNPKSKQKAPTNGNMNKTVTTIGTNEIPVKPSYSTDPYYGLEQVVIPFEIETVTINANKIPVNVSNLGLNIVSEQIVSTSDSMTETITTIATTEAAVKTSSDSDQNIPLDELVTTSETITETIATNETTEVLAKLLSSEGKKPASNKYVTKIEKTTENLVITPTTQVPVNMSSTEGRNPESQHAVSTKENINKIVTTIEVPIKASPDSDGNIGLELIGTILENITKTAAINETAKEQVNASTTVKDQSTGHEQNITNIESITESVVIVSTTEIPLKLSSIVGQNTESQQIVSTKDKVTTTEVLPVKTSYNSDPIIGLEKTLNTSQKITETAQTSDTTELLVTISSTVDQNTDTKLNTTKIEKIVENMNIIPTTEVSIKRSSTEGQNIAFGPIITALEKGPDIITVDTATEVLVAVSTTESINAVSSQTVSQLENTIAIVTNAATDHPITMSTTNDLPNRTVTTFENKAEAIILSTATEVPAVTSFIKDLNNGFDIEFTTELAVNKFQDAVNKSTSNTPTPIDTIVVSKISQEYKHPLISDSIGNLKSLKLKDGVAPLISATDNQRISSTESQVSKLDNTNITHENNIKSNMITINDQIKVDTSTGMTDKPSNLELYQTMTTLEQMFNNSVTLSRENVHPKEITNNEVTITSILNNITTPSNVVLILKNEINNLSNESAHQNTINNVTDANSVNNSSQKSILLEELQTVSSNSRIQTGNTTMTASEDKLKFENPTEMRTQKQISLMTERMPISNYSNNLEILRTTQQTFNLSEVNDGLTNAQKRRNNNTNNARNITNKWAQKESVTTITDNVTWNPVLSTDSTSKTETSTSNGLQSVSLLTNTVDNSLNTDITTHINLEVLDGNFGTVPTAEKTEALSTTEYSMQSNPTDIKIPSILKSPIISGISAISNENQITHELRQTQPVTEQLLAHIPAQIPKVIDSFVTHNIKSPKTDKEYSSNQTNFTATTAEQHGDNKGQNKSLLAPSVIVKQNKTTTSDLIKILMPQIDTETVSSLKSNIMTIDAVSRDKYQTEMQTETPTVITLNAVLNDSSVTNIEVSNVNDKAGRFPTGTMKKRSEVTEQTTVDVHTFPEIPPSTISNSGPLKPLEISLPSHGLTNDPLTTQTSTYISDVSRTHTYSHLTFTKDVKTVNAPTDYPYTSNVFSTNAQPVTETPSPTKIGSLVSHDNYVGKHILPTYVTESYLEHVNNNFGNGLPNIDSVAKAQAQTLTTQTESNTQSSNAAHITSGNVIGMPTGNQIISPASIQNIDKNVWNDLNMGKMLTTEVNFMDQSLLTSPTSAIINQEAIRLRTSKDNTATFEPYTIDFLTYAPVVTTQVPVILNDNEQIATIKEKNVHEEQTGHQVGAISLEQQSNPLQNLLLNSTIAIQRQKPISTVDLHQYFEKNGNDSISTIQNVSETNISTDSGTESANLSSSTKVLTKLSGSEKTINSQLNDDSFTSNFSKQNKQHSTDSTSPRLQTTLSLPVTQAHVTIDTVGQISNLNKKNNGSFVLATDKNIQPPALSTVSEFRMKFTTSSITLEKTNHTVTSTNSPIESDASSKLTNILTTESTQPMHAELLSNFAELPSYNTKSRSSISGDQTSGIKQIVSPKSETNISFKTATDKDVTEPKNKPTKSDVVTAYDSQINSFSKRETLNPVQPKVDLTNRTNTSPVKSKFGIDDKNKKIMSYVTIPVTQNISRNIDAMDYTKSTKSSINVGVGTKASTTLDVLVDTNIKSGKTHSGIVSLITQAPKSNDAKEKKEESEKAETQDEEKPEHSVNVELGSLQSNGPSTLSTEKSTPILKENTVKRDVLTREELIPQVPNKNFNSNNASYPKELISTNISISNSNYRGTNTTVSENKKVTPTHELIINSTTLTNSNNASSDKSQDQNKRIPLAHNMTVISHDQSITFNNMSHIKSTSAGDMQTTGFPAFQSTTQKTALQKFSCKQRKRGRYADEQDCRKFYICPGNKSSHVVEGSCPVNTVFSEINKQCTKNLSHCIRNNQFRCVTEGRFSDFLNDNVYYICVRNNLNHFIRFKLQCQNGYRLNKTSVRCDLNSESTSTSESKSVSEQSSSAIKQETTERPEKKFKCKKEGVFPDPSNCQKYYECIKVDSSYRQKKKKCDSDEIFHKDKKKCVDAESNEC